MPDPWTARVDREFTAHNISRGERDALHALAAFRGHDGSLFPSQASVAARAQCSERTVRRALVMGAKLGLLVVLPRRKWVRGRFVRASNRYIIGVPDRAVTPGQRPLRPRATGQTDHGQERKKEALEEMLQQAAAAPDLLALRRAMMERRMAGIGRHTV